MKKYCLSAAALFFCAGLADAELIDEMIEDALSKVPASLENVPENLQRVAIYSIEPDKTKKVNSANFQDQLISVLLESGRFSVIDRQALNYLIEEQKLSQSGLVSTAEMVKIGQVVGVQGFFFGSVEFSEDHLTLNLKLVDVESSAIVYSKKFSGKAVSAARLGVGFASAGGIYTAHTRHLMYDSFLGRSKLIDEKDFAEEAASGFAVLFSYKQGSKMIRWTQMGFDIQFGHHNVLEYTPAGSVDLNDSPADTETDYGINYELQVIFLKLVPKLYLSSEKLFGWKNDILNIYAGVGMNMLFFSESMGGWQYDNDTFQQTDYDTEERDEMLFAVTPVLGLEFNLSKSISLFAETSFYSESKITGRGEAYFAKMNFDTTPGTAGGMATTAGLKYYWK